jgi:dihydrofolate reductase
MEKQLKLIVALTENYIIGTVNTPIPWNLTDDFVENFVPKTKLIEGTALIMGGKTEETLKKPLEGRTNIVITRNTSKKREGFIFVKDELEAVMVAKSCPGDSIWCIGGGTIYRLFQNTFVIDEYHITIIENFDKKFPPEETIFFIPNLSAYKSVSNTRFEKREPDPNKKRDKGNEYSFNVHVFKKQGFNSPLF